MNSPYWQTHHFDKIKVAKSYRELFDVAKDILNHMPPPVGEVCGPISTGGFGSIEANVERFKTAIVDLEKQGFKIFNQIPFQERMLQILNNREAEASYDYNLLEDFYLPIFESKLVHNLYFLPDWQSSVGAKWEHEQAKRLGMGVIYLD